MRTVEAVHSSWPDVARGLRLRESSKRKEGRTTGLGTSAAVAATDPLSIEEPAMKKIICVLTLSAALPLVSACTKSVEKAQRDVQRAHEQAVDRVTVEQRKAEDARMAAEQKLSEAKRDVEEVARRENEKVIKEERALEDAKRVERERANP
jgi:hypothetical protein